MSELSIYDFDLIMADGSKVSMSAFKGKIILIVNTASNCTFNKQLYQLQELYSKYGDKLVIIGVPCNQFGAQEILPNEKIIERYKEKFNVTFPLHEKSVVNGKKELPLYTYLKNEKKSLLGFKGLKWNFEKFLINQQGEVVKRYSTYVLPPSIEKDILELM